MLWLMFRGPREGWTMKPLALVAAGFVLMLTISVLLYWRLWGLEKAEVDVKHRIDDIGLNRGTMLKYGFELGLDCVGVIEGDSNAISRAIGWQSPALEPSIGEGSCDEVVASLGFRSADSFGGCSNRSMDNSDPTAKPLQEADGKFRPPRPRAEAKCHGIFAHVVVTHGDFEQTLRLLRALTLDNDDVVCIHVDVKASPEYWALLRRVVKCVPGIVITKRIDVAWGGISLVRAVRSCMQRLLKLETPWTHLMNTAATAFPLRTHTELDAILSYIGPYNLVKVEEDNLNGTGIDTQGRTKNKKDQPDVHLVKGSQYGVYTREFVQFLISDERVNKFFDWLADTDIPDEFFYVSVNHDNNLKAPGGYPIQNSLRGFFQSATFQAWVLYNRLSLYRLNKERAQQAIREKSVRKETVPYSSNYDWPRCVKARHWSCVFGIDDVPKLIRYPHLKINKFLMESIQPAALMCMEEVHRNRSLSNQINVDWEYYRRIKNRILTGKQMD